MTVHTTIDHDIFTTVQAQIEEDSQIRENIRNALKSLDKHTKQANALLSRVHSLPANEVPGLVEKTKPVLEEAYKELGELIKLVEPYPYYKYNQLWTKDLQSLTFLVLLSTWLERVYGEEKKDGNALLNLEETGQVLGIPVNLKTEDKFHLTIEEYLHAVISLVDELARLMTNAVIQRDFTRPQLISTFVKDIFASFQVLNLKNDALRRRGDALKYQVKKVEDINYDLAVRNLVPQSGEEKKDEGKEGDVKMEG